MTDGIPAMIRCDLARSVRYKGYLLGFHCEHQVYKLLLLAIAFNIEFCGNDFFYFEYVPVSDMSFVRSRMDCDPISAKTLCVNSCLHYIGIVSTPAVPDGRKLIDVNRKFCHIAKVKARNQFQIQISGK